MSTEEPSLRSPNLFRNVAQQKNDFIHEAAWLFVGYVMPMGRDHVGNYTEVIEKCYKKLHVNLSFSWFFLLFNLVFNTCNLES